MCSSPRLIAAYHDLHRLSMPRHPPCALLRLISIHLLRHEPKTRATIWIPHTRRLSRSRTPEPTSTPSISQLSKSQVKASETKRSAGDFRESFDRTRSTRYLQKGGDPAAGSPTATLLRLRPSHQARLRPLPPCGWLTDFGRSQLPWRDGRCVQGPGTDSPWRS